MSRIRDEFNASTEDARISSRGEAILRAVTVGPVLWAAFFLPLISVWKRVGIFFGGMFVAYVICGGFKKFRARRSRCDGA